MCQRIAAVVSLLLGLSWSVTAAQSDGGEELRLLAGTAVQRFIADFSNVVAEEVYELRSAASGRNQRLKSDFLLVAYPGSSNLLITFRDVREVNGRSVGGQQDRATRLFLEPFDDAAARAREIHREGLRHVLDGIELADPLMVISHLQPRYQKDFRFTVGRLERSLGLDVREVTLIPTALPDRPERAIRERVWVSEKTGDVMKTEFRFGNGIREVTTLFAVDAKLRIRVPVETQDSMSGPGGDRTSTVRYSNFRRFQVQTESAVEPGATPR